MRWKGRDLRATDRMRASVAALVLLAAGFLLFVVYPAGLFEGGAAWFFALMPGMFVGAPLADRVFKIAPSAEPFVFWLCSIGITFAWYFAISYGTVKTYRLLRGAIR